MEAEFIQKLSNTESELKKSVAYVKKRVILLICFMPFYRIFRHVGYFTKNEVFPQFLGDLVTFTEEILDGKLHFCALGERFYFLDPWLN